jgi:hypothetical protein
MLMLAMKRLAKWFAEDCCLEGSELSRCARRSQPWNGLTDNAYHIGVTTLDASSIFLDLHDANRGMWRVVGCCCAKWLLSGSRRSVLQVPRLPNLRHHGMEPSRPTHVQSSPQWSPTNCFLIKPSSIEKGPVGVKREPS